MDDVDKKIGELLALTKQTSSISSKANSVFVLAALLQESVSLNQQWSQTARELVEVLNNERKRKGSIADGGEVSGASRENAG